MSAFPGYDGLCFFFFFFDKQAQTSFKEGKKAP